MWLSALIKPRHKFHTPYLVWNCCQDVYYITPSVKVNIHLIQQCNKSWQQTIYTYSTLRSALKCHLTLSPGCTVKSEKLTMQVQLNLSFLLLNTEAQENFECLILKEFKLEI